MSRFTQNNRISNTDKTTFLKKLVNVDDPQITEDPFYELINNLMDELDHLRNRSDVLETAGIAGPKGDKGDTGAKGDRGLRGYKGNIGNQGPVGADGATGNSHLSNVTSIGFNSKGQLEVVISGTTKKFNAAK